MTEAIIKILIFNKIAAFQKEVYTLEWLKESYAFDNYLTNISHKIVWNFQNVRSSFFEAIFFTDSEKFYQTFTFATPKQ